MSKGGGGSSEAARLNSSLNDAVRSSRKLTAEIGGLKGGLGMAAGEAGALAAAIAEIAGSERLAEMATGIGIVVALIGTAVAGVVSWRDETKDIAEKIRNVAAETAKLNAQAAGNTRLAKQIEITDAMEGEVFAAEKLEHFYRKFPGLLDAIRAKADAARKAAAAATDRAFMDAMGSSSKPYVNPFSGPDRNVQYLQAQADAQHERDEQLRLLRRNDQGYNADQQAALQGSILSNYTNAITDAQYQFQAPARQFGEQIGRSIAASISDGIAAGIKGHSIADGFKSITGSLLMGLGDLMVNVGTESLLAAQLMAKIISALQDFAPEGAIGPALLLIAAGGALKGLGASMASGGGSARNSVATGAVLTGGMVVASPSAGNAGSLSAIRPVTNHFTVIGTADARAQRDIVSLVDAGLARQGRRI